MAAEGDLPRRLFVRNLGFVTNARLRRILALSGWKVTLFGRPGKDDYVGVWGNSPTAHRGETLAERTGARLVRIEDAFLRSVQTGRDGEPPLGVLIDTSGVHFDSAAPSDLEVLLATQPLDDAALLTRARHAMERMVYSHISKYNAFDPNLQLPKAPYVLVIDQTLGDASIEKAGANKATFREMLVAAQTENPGLRVVIKTHPETIAGHRQGHYGPDDAAARVSLVEDDVDPWQLLEGAVSVYTVSSGMGFEAILAGHRPRVFGQPWYSSWGLTEDEYPVPRRQRTLTRTQMFAAAMILYPVWYDPHHDTLCGIEQVISSLQARARAWREDRNGHVAAGIRLWKRAPFNKFFGQAKGLVFTDPASAVTKAQQTKRTLLVWANRADALASTDDTPVLRVEDGFLRSKGLGATLTPPLSLVTDDLGIYYDPTSQSRLESLISASLRLPEGAKRRTERLIKGIRVAKLSKYNLSRPCPPLPDGHRILVPGQVEDDESIRLGCRDVRTNLGLLMGARAANPNAIIVYKPHPDVEAGLRTGAIDRNEALRFADVVAEEADPVALLEAADEVWTMTSLLGFEALLRGKAVTCLGAPFYAGWGLTVDLGWIPVRRTARPDIVTLAHAVLIDYPRYFDPVIGQPCPPEVVADRLASDIDLPNRRANKVLAKMQGRFSSFSWIWRRG